MGTKDGPGHFPSPPKKILGVKKKKKKKNYRPMALPQKNLYFDPSTSNFLDPSLYPSPRTCASTYIYNTDQVLGIIDQILQRKLISFQIIHILTIKY
jgi:hypothetical protein